MDDRERAELEMYRRMYAAPEEQQHTASYGDMYSSPAQDALTDEEQAAFWPEALDTMPKYQIAERHRQVYGSWAKKTN